MKGFAILLMMLALFGALPATAQEASDPADRLPESSAGAEHEHDATALPDPELREALDQLAGALDGLFSRIANNPELRRSAVDAAEGMADVAAIVIAQQTELLQRVLKRAAEELEQIEKTDTSRDAAI